MAADVAEFLWNKSLNALQEAETELFFQFTLASHFQGIKQVLESQNKNICCSSLASDMCDVLYELNDILTECRIFAQQRKLFKKNWIHFNPYTESLFVRKRKNQLGSVKTKNQLDSVSAAFSTKIWVCFEVDIGIKSNETNIGIQILKLVLKELDYNIDELMMDKHDMVELLETIHLLISHEKYLIVFDDVWPWHANFLAAEINSAGGLPRGSGGAVIVTTRLKKVARRIGGENMIDPIIGR